MNKRQEVQVQFLISGANPAEAFDPLEKVFYVVALTIGDPAVRARIVSVAPWRYTGCAPRMIYPVADVITVKTSVGHDAFPFHKDDFLGCNSVPSLSGRQAQVSQFEADLNFFRERLP